MFNRTREVHRQAQELIVPQLQASPRGERGGNVPGFVRSDWVWILVQPLPFWTNAEFLWASLSCSEISSPEDLRWASQGPRGQTWCLLSNKYSRWELPSLLAVRQLAWVAGAVEHSLPAHASLGLQASRRFYLVNINLFRFWGEDDQFVFVLPISSNFLICEWGGGIWLFREHFPPLN